jgi:hypothetical protein
MQESPTQRLPSDEAVRRFAVSLPALNRSLPFGTTIACRSDQWSSPQLRGGRKPLEGEGAMENYSMRHSDRLVSSLGLDKGEETALRSNGEVNSSSRTGASRPADPKAT